MHTFRKLPTIDPKTKVNTSVIICFLRLDWQGRLPTTVRPTPSPRRGGLRVNAPHVLLGLEDHLAQADVEKLLDRIPGRLKPLGDAGSCGVRDVFMGVRAGQDLPV